MPKNPSTKIKIIGYLLIIILLITLVILVQITGLGQKLKSSTPSSCQPKTNTFDDPEEVKVSSTGTGTGKAAALRDALAKARPALNSACHDYAGIAFNSHKLDCENTRTHECDPFPQPTCTFLGSPKLVQPQDGSDAVVYKFVSRNKWQASATYTGLCQCVQQCQQGEELTPEAPGPDALLDGETLRAGTCSPAFASASATLFTNKVHGDRIKKTGAANNLQLKQTVENLAKASAMSKALDCKRANTVLGAHPTEYSCPEPCHGIDNTCYLLLSFTPREYGWIRTVYYNLVTSEWIAQAWSRGKCDCSMTCQIRKEMEPKDPVPEPVNNPTNEAPEVNDPVPDNPTNEEVP